jgi:hypothetical protein
MASVPRPREKPELIHRWNISNPLPCVIRFAPFTPLMLSCNKLRSFHWWDVLECLVTGFFKTKTKQLKSIFITLSLDPSRGSRLTSQPRREEGEMWF